MGTGVYDRYDTLLVRTSHAGALQALAESGNMVSVTDQSWQYWKNTAGDFTAQMWQALMRREVVRFVVVSLVHNSLWVNLQGSVLAVARAADPEHRVDAQTMLSVTISLLAATRLIVAHAMKIYGMNQKLTEAAKFAPSPDDLEAARNSQYVFAAFVASLVLAISLLLYCAAKVVAAIFVCEEGVWNISGCVHPNLLGAAAV